MEVLFESEPIERANQLPVGGRSFQEERPRVGKASWVWPEQREPYRPWGGTVGSLGLILRMAGSSCGGSSSMTRFTGWEDPLVAVGMSGLQQ